MISIKIDLQFILIERKLRMAYKPRKKSKKLIILGILNNRMTLLEKDSQHYYSLKKGYEGEVVFDSLTEKLSCNCYILNDLLLKVNNTTFQIDTLIITEKINIFEVKNYIDDYYLDGDRLYKVPKTEYTNPLVQLTRCESLLRQLLHNLGLNLPIEAKVVFINPEFTLYQAPLDKPIIHPTQVNRFINHFDTENAYTELTELHNKLAEKLVSLHSEEDPYSNLPIYKYKHLKKGFTCKICDSFSISVRGNRCVCEDCKYEESVESTVIRTVTEVKLLFPEWKITTSGVLEWCTAIKCKRRISRILGKHFKMEGKRKGIYYK